MNSYLAYKNESNVVRYINPSQVTLTCNTAKEYENYFFPINIDNAHRHNLVNGYVVSMQSCDNDVSLHICILPKIEYSVEEKIIPEYITDRQSLVKTGGQLTFYPQDYNSKPYNYARIYPYFVGKTINPVGLSAWCLYGDLIKPVVSSDFVSGFARFDQSNRINYSVEYDQRMHSQFTITAGKFYYKLTSESSYSSITFSGTSITIPANTFIHGSNYNVYSVVTVDDGQTSTTPVKTLSTVDGTPYCTAISPVNEIVYGSATLKWSYSNSSGMNQFKYDLQISSDGSSWTYVANGVTSSETSRYVSSIASGISYWRVRSYNQDSTASSWSQAYFVNSVPPDAPVITQIIQSGRPTVKWSCSDQVAYEFMLGDYKSGDQYTTNRYCFVDDYIVNGNYPIKVRVSNKYGLWSSWTTSTYSQNMTASVPNASIEQIEKGFQITLTDSSFSKVYVIRNGVVIGKFNGNTYFDPYVNSDTEYIIRGVMADDTFADLQITKSYVCRKSALITTSGDVYNVSDRIDNHPEISFSVKRSSVTSEFYGRSKPAHFMNDLYTRNWKVTCRYKDIKDHLGEVMFYRNYDGYSAWVVCTSTSSGITMYGDEVSIPLEETDYKEGIEYDL